MGDCFFMAENYFVESRSHIKVILTIMATREEYRDIFSHRLTGSLDQYQKSLLSVQIL